MRSLRILGLVAPLVAGCDERPVVPDASTMDAGRDALIVRPDAPELVCPVACGATETCCEVDGDRTCLTLMNDVAHCGSCTNDCIALDRGDACANGMCSCGDVDIGCLGGPRSTCCITPSGAGNCADTLHDFDDCGGCGARCDVLVSDQCLAGDCVCGDTGGPCTGGLSCCSPRFGGGPATCVSLDDDDENCGACHLRCGAFEVCRDRLCVSAADAGPRDAGPRDAGGADAGTDAGPDDAGDSDAL